MNDANGVIIAAQAGRGHCGKFPHQIRRKQTGCCEILEGSDRSASINERPEQRLSLLPAALEHVLEE